MNKRLSLIITIVCAALISPTYAKDIRPVFNAGVDFFNIDPDYANGYKYEAADTLALMKIGFGIEGRLNNQFKIAGLFNYGFESSNSDLTEDNMPTNADIFIKSLSQFQVKFMFEPQEEIYLFFAPTYTSAEYELEVYNSYGQYNSLTKKETDMGFALGGGLNVSENASIEAQIARISSDISQYGLTASFKF